MARANRHFIPGLIWHLTHRCHKRDFLFRFAKDRRRWLQWLYEAKKRYGLTILNYMVTSNHIHLLVKCNGDRDVIPKSIKLVAGRIAQEYNQRKQRSGAFWEDRYHATAVEGGRHLLRCLVYIDLNMVRAGKVKHPSQWLFGGYNEIQAPKRKNVLIDYESLRTAVGFESYDQVRFYHKKWVEELLQNGKNIREDKWSKSLGVGSQTYIEEMKFKLDGLVMGRKVIETVEDYQLRDPAADYMARSDTEKYDIGHENAHFWDIT